MKHILTFKLGKYRLIISKKKDVHVFKIQSPNNNQYGNCFNVIRYVLLYTQCTYIWYYIGVQLNYMSARGTTCLTQAFTGKDEISWDINCQFADTVWIVTNAHSASCVRSRSYTYYRYSAKERPIRHINTLTPVPEYSSWYGKSLFHDVIWHIILSRNLRFSARAHTPKNIM